jgi:hypothetical protein
MAAPAFAPSGWGRFILLDILASKIAAAASAAEAAERRKNLGGGRVCVEAV